MSSTTGWRIPSFLPWGRAPKPAGPSVEQRLRAIVYDRAVPGVFQATAQSFAQLRTEARSYLLRLGVRTQPDVELIAEWEERLAGIELRDQTWSMRHQRVTDAIARQQERVTELRVGPYRESCSGLLQRAAASAAGIFGLLDASLVEQRLANIDTEIVEARLRVDAGLRAATAFEERGVEPLLDPSCRFSSRIARDQKELERLLQNARSARDSGNYDVLIRDDRAINELSNRLEQSIFRRKEVVDRSFLNWSQLCEGWDAFRQFFGKRIMQVRMLAGKPQFPSEWARLAADVHYYILSAATKAGNADQSSIRDVAGLRRRELKWNRPPGFLYRDYIAGANRNLVLTRWDGERWIEPDALQRLASIVDTNLASVNGDTPRAGTGPDADGEAHDTGAVPANRLLP